MIGRPTERFGIAILIRHRGAAHISRDRPGGLSYIAEKHAGFFPSALISTPQRLCVEAYFLNFKSRLAAFRESKELSVLVGLDSPLFSALSS
jgi:hypothetical protein